MPNKGWVESAYPNLAGCTVRVLEWISNFISHIIKDVSTYLCWINKNGPGRMGAQARWYDLSNGAIRTKICIKHSKGRCRPFTQIQASLRHTLFGLYGNKETHTHTYTCFHFRNESGVRFDHSNANNEQTISQTTCNIPVLTAHKQTAQVIEVSHVVHGSPTDLFDWRR